jgi:hypothetical protein
MTLKLCLEKLCLERREQRNGRLKPHPEPWRLGANVSTPAFRGRALNPAPRESERSRGIVPERFRDSVEGLIQDRPLGEPPGFQVIQEILVF